MKLKLFHIAFVLFTIPTALFAQPDEKLHKKCLYPTAQVTAFAHGQMVSGTAFVTRSEKVGNKYHNCAITCQHICGSNMKIILQKYKNWSVLDAKIEEPCSSYSLDAELDIAVLLFVTEESVDTVDLEFNKDLYIGNDIFRIGHGLGDEARLDYGKITGLDITVKGFLKNVNKSSIHTVQGDSGGPVFTNDYKVIGLMRGIRGDQTMQYNNISYFVPIDKVKKLNVDFGFDNSQKLPYIPFKFLEFSKYKLQD